jgi:gluconolactonase
MSALVVLTSLFLADPTPEQLAVLKTFREEFVPITPEQRRLKLFSIAKFEVTQELWQAVMGNNPSRWKGKRNSVELVSLDEAHAFCRKATELMRAAALIKNNQVIRLPYEEEWEYAVRAGTTTKYSFGDDAALLGQYAWFTGNAAGNDPPVGAKKPNSWGLYDVHGYLWEWTSGGVIQPDTALLKGIIRGGSWKDKAEDLDSSSRRVVDRTLRDDAIGFRCVLVEVQPTQSGVSQAGAKGGAAAADFVPTAQGKIVPAGAKLELLWGDGEFTEGPALAPDGSIYFSDIGQSIYRYDPNSAKTELFRRPSGRTNGLMFNQRGELIACEGANTGGNRRISLTSGIDGLKDGAVRTLADRFEGKRFNSPNDLAIDALGRVYFTDPRYVGSEPRELDFEAVFLVAPDGGMNVATREVQKPNGILVSPDGKTVYVSDNNPQGNRYLVAFTVKADGTLEGKRVLHDFGTGRGIDGMALDTTGNIYATAGSGDKAGVYVFSPEGKPLALIPTPGDPTNCEFGGGADSSTLYVTSANSKTPGTKYGLFRIKLNATGHHVVKLN